MLDFLLTLDKNLLIQARSLMSEDMSIWIILCAELVVVWYALFLVGLWLRGRFTGQTELKKIALNIAVLILLVFGIYSVLNFGIPQWRASPQDVIGSIKALIPRPMDNSFPSGHALFWGAGLFAIISLYKNPTIIVLSVVIGLVSNLSRIFGAIHYPGDTIFGFIIGFLGAYIFLSLSKKITELLFPFVQKIASIFRL